MTIILAIRFKLAEILAGVLDRCDQQPVLGREPDLRPWSGLQLGGFI
jgi:hypothetical protein